MLGAGQRAAGYHSVLYDTKPNCACATYQIVAVLRTDQTAAGSPDSIRFQPLKIMNIRGQVLKMLTLSPLCRK